MELKDNDYIGLFSGIYSKDCDKDPIKFLSKKENIWYGASIAIFYPEVMEWDIVCSLPTGPTRAVNDIFLKAAFYGDDFSIIDSVHGICDNCEVNKFEVRATTGEQTAYIRAIVKVGNFIPYDYEKDYIENNPSEILKNLYYSENPTPTSWCGELVKSKDMTFGPLTMIGLGDIQSHRKQVVLKSNDDKKYCRKGYFSVFFGIPVYGALRNDGGRVLSSLNGNLKLSTLKKISTGNSQLNAEDIKEESVFKCKLGPYEFSIEDAKKGEVNRVIDKDVDDEPKNENVQIYSVKINGNIKYELNTSS